MFIWIEVPIKILPELDKKQVKYQKKKIKNGQFWVNLINFYFTFSKTTINFTVFRKFEFWFCYYELFF